MEEHRAFVAAVHYVNSVSRLSNIREHMMLLGFEREYQSVRQHGRRFQKYLSDIASACGMPVILEGYLNARFEENRQGDYCFKFVETIQSGSTVAVTVTLEKNPRVRLHKYQMVATPRHDTDNVAMSHASCSDANANGLASIKQAEDSLVSRSSVIQLADLFPCPLTRTLNVPTRVQAPDDKGKSTAEFPGVCALDNVINAIYKDGNLLSGMNINFLYPGPPHFGRADTGRSLRKTSLGSAASLSSISLSRYAREDCAKVTGTGALEEITSPTRPLPSDIPSRAPSELEFAANSLASITDHPIIAREGSVAGDDHQGP
jgi:hypothetical protein